MRVDPIAYILGVKKILLSYFGYYLGSPYLKIQSLSNKPGVGYTSKIIPKRLNFRKTTDLCFIMHAEGSDKGLSSHNYTTFYSSVFPKNRRLKIKRVFELGIGSNNPETPSNMGKGGVPGGSLRGWRKFFPKATIFGADIDRGTLFKEERIRTFYCDQQDSESIDYLWTKNPELKGNFDLIIEDGFHSFRANISFFENSVRKLKVGGVYVIEDIDEYLVRLWRQTIQSFYLEKYPNLAFCIVEIPLDKNPYNNKLIVIERIR
ncbi:MAG TPA: hypothetical protein VJ227_03440 [Patescibacteria group bacterium]|nr:hypothetical protein [Patescibacteria group bacterium]